MTLFIYSLIAGTLLSLFWATYRIAGMQRLSHFGLNRALLAGSLLLALGLPFAAFRTIANDDDIEPAGQFVLAAGDEPVGQIEFIEASEPAFDWTPVLQGAASVYLIGVGACALWMLIGLAGVLLAVATGHRQGRLVIHRRRISPFAWGHWIVISERDCDNRAILLHEDAHLRAAHWVDLLLSRAATCILWYWPTVWLLNRDLREAHEFEADRAVLNAGVAAADYQLMLIGAASGHHFPSVVNPFNFYSLKHRIAMMKMKQSPARSRMRALVMLPAVAAAAIITSAPTVASTVSDFLPKDEPRAQEGVTVILEPAVDEVNAVKPVQIVTDDADAVVATTETVKVTAPAESATEPADTAATPKIYFRTHKPDPNGGYPLFILDGVPVKPEVVSNMTEDDFESIEVRKDQEFTSQYGEAGKNGVLVMTSKKKSAPKADDADNPFVNVDVPPRFNGDDTDMYRWLSKNMRYPEEAAKKNIQGRVIVQFIVEKDGSIGDTKVIRGVDPLLDAEAVRVVKTLPKFIPGTQNGEPKRVWFTLPLTFKLTGDDKPQAAEESTTLDPKDVTAAEYPGGETAMMQFVVRNIRYPEADAIAGKSGTVNLKVCIEKDGKIGEIKVENNTGSEAMATEAIRVARKFPKFKPATYKGEPMASWIPIPFTFRTN